MNAVLNEIGAGGKRRMMVFNKWTASSIERAGDALNRLQGSIETPYDFGHDRRRRLVMLAEIGTQLRPKREFLELRVPHEQAAVIARFTRSARSFRAVIAAGGAIQGPYSAALPREFAPYIVREAQAVS